METRKTIAVIGATGAQGGGLVRAILADPERRFIARALTRDTQSAKARELAALGAEVVSADVDDEASLARALGRPVDHYSPSPAEYRSYGFPGADDLGNMFQFNAEFEKDFCAARSIELSRRLNPALQDFRGWLERNKTRIPLA